MADADYDDIGGYPEARQGLGMPDAARVQRWVNLAGGVASLALVVGLGVWGYRLAVRDVTGVPVVQALEGPMRIAPADPGGEIADHQGLSVNTVAEVGIAAPVPDRLILAPRPVDLAPEDMAGIADPLASGAAPGLADVSAPLASPAAMDPADANLALAAAPPVESANPTEIAVDAALAEALGLDISAVSAPDVSPELAPDLAPDLAAEVAALAPAGALVLSPRPRARPDRAPSNVAPTAQASPTAEASLPAANEIDPATIPIGTRLVQFGAFDSADEARAEWARLAGRFGDLMAGKSMVVQPAESGGRTFWRLRGHGFEDEADARRFCSAFVAQSAICIPVPQR
ncbi:SPOR domain-containing protein [Tabrizicola sp.]|uniref:SPOR domain-containing protein n=1 Tax=Tabrizicola sp. TaxID=2005166 RepID=UPI0026261647|nr:SPOR domain-containing protein [Tabrizicola sp.]MDM7931082.1 SPOR domain-containing protein [Tabrizicola sp.]